MQGNQVKATINSVYIILALPVYKSSETAVKGPVIRDEKVAFSTDGTDIRLQ